MIDGYLIVFFLLLYSLVDVVVFGLWVVNNGLVAAENVETESWWRLIQVVIYPSEQVTSTTCCQKTNQYTTFFF